MSTQERLTHRFGFAVIGCGDIAMTQHLPVIANHPRARLLAVCDADPLRAEEARERFGAARAVTDYQEVLADPSVEVVIVATPPWITPGLTKAALQAGKDVLCEKPMAVSIEEAESVAAVERAGNRLVQIGFTYRHGPLMDALRDWVASGRLGDPLVIRMGVFDEVWAPTANPEHYERIMATLRHGPPCLHDGAHCADHLNFLTGSDAVRVTAWGVTTRPEFPAPNYNLAHIEFANGATAKLEIGWFYPHFPPGEFEIMGPLGVARLDRAKCEVVLEAGGAVEHLQMEGDWFRSCFKAQFEKFLHALEHRHPPVPGTREGIASLRLTKAIEQAMREGKPVDLS